MNLKLILSLFAIIIFGACQSTTTKREALQTVQLFAKGDKVPNDKFTGNVYQAILGKIGTQTSNVTFEPKGRTFWHLHPGGQTLLVTDGEGYYQEEGKRRRIIKKGDVINTNRNVKHWHGGTKDSSMTHIAISIDHEAQPSQWFQEVSEQQYAGD